MSAEVLKWIVIMGGIILLFLLIVFGSKNGWFKSFSAGKDGISFESKEIKEKAFKLESLGNMMNKAISECDHDLLDAAYGYADSLRRSLSSFLDSFIKYPAGKRSLSAAMRLPLYNAIRRNRLKIELRPENIEKYINRIMDEIEQEYCEADEEQQNFICPVHGTSCIVYPSWESIKDHLRDIVKDKWALLVKGADIAMHKHKIEIYEEYKSTFRELGDDKSILICDACIKKNQDYIAELTKKVFQEA